MCLEHQRRLKAIPGSIIMVVIRDEGFSEGIETMDLMEYVNLDSIGTFFEPPTRRCCESSARILVDMKHV